MTRAAATYWVATGILAGECVTGGVMGGLRLSPFSDIGTHLGYPGYFLTVLGLWYFAAGLVILAPRFERLEEWAYAGLVFNYTGAAISHLAVGDGIVMLVAPVAFLGLTVTSWSLRPRVRRDSLPNPLANLTVGSARGRVAYWIVTVLVAAELGAGGVADLLRLDAVRDVVEQLGYPTYLLTIMGAWKVAGAVVLLLPGLARVKEWAYAGAVITYVSAIVSHLTVGIGTVSLVAAAVLLALALASWTLYPARHPAGYALQR